MSACVFVGPTLSSHELPKAPGFVFLPPVAQGDMCRAAQSRPRAIGIIDGYFDGVAAVWHKEILFAMTQGIHVFGSASMGALRAAELDGFGMRGVGRIFAAYRDGCLPPFGDAAFEDDDEVAVIHGPREAGYVVLSEAMVNIRCTLAAAAAAGIIATGTRDALARLAKGLFYQERTYERVLAGATAESLPQQELEALRAWLPDGRIDQKRADALAMLAEMQALLQSDPGPLRVDYVLEWTEMWDGAMRAAATARLVDRGGKAEWLSDAGILDELRLDADAYPAVRERALLRFLARREADQRRQRVDGRMRSEILRRFRIRHGLLKRADLDRWLEANDIDAAGLERLLDHEAHLQTIAALPESALCEHLLDDLRRRGDYRRLAARARAKQELLLSLGLDQPRPEDAGSAPGQLVTWYFERRLGRGVPDDLDATAHELGFASVADFHRALLREWLYCREGGGGS